MIHVAGLLMLNEVVCCYCSLTIFTDDDYEPLSEIGEITSREKTRCHNVTIIDDSLVEAEEMLQVRIVEEFNVASVLLSPHTATILIDDTDSKISFFSSTVEPPHKTCLVRERCPLLYRGVLYLECL